MSVPGADGHRTVPPSTVHLEARIRELQAELEKLRSREPARGPSCEQLQLIADHVPALLAYVDTQCRYQFCNRAYTAWFGLTTEEILGRSMREVLGEDAWRIIRPHIKTALAGRAFEYEAEVQYKTGNRRSIHAAYTPHVDAAGTVHGVVMLVTDITERKRAEAKLRQLEDRYNALFHSIDQAFCTLEVLFDEHQKPVDYRFLEVSPSFERQTGIENAVGRWMRDIAPGQDPYSCEVYGHVALTGEPARFEYFSAPLQRWWTVYAFRIDDPECRHVAVLFNDVTERKRAEGALRESEEKYRRLFESIDQGFCTIEVLFDENEKPVDYRFLLVNPAFERQTGIPHAVGRRMREIAPQHEEHWFQIYGHIALTGEARRFENRAAQLHRYYEVYAWRVGTPAERKVAILFNDITERKRVEEALRESEGRLQKALSIDTVGVLFFTLDGRMIDANAAFQRMSGYSREELRVVDWNTLTPPECFAVTAHAAEELATKGETAPYEKQHIRRDGSRWWGLFAPTRLKGTGPASECVAFIIDITERKRAEEEVHRLLREAQRRERELREQQEQLVQAAKLASLGEMASGIAHELNNPLNNINLCVGNVLDRLRDAHIDPAIEASLSLAQRETTKAAKIIDHLRTFARKPKAATEQISLNTVVREAVQLLETQFSLCDIRVESIYSPEDPVVTGSGIQLEQVLVNLLTNARDAVEHADSKLISVSTGREDRDAIITVKDTGHGIALHALSRIFDPFYTTKDVGKGTGLGLSISYRIVKDMGGSISVDSETGVGTAFVIRLPLRAGPAEGADGTAV